MAANGGTAALRFAIALALVAALCACGSTSNGSCTGRIGSTVLSGPINAATSKWHVPKGSALAVLVLRYTNDTLRIEAQVDRTSAGTSGTYPLPTGSGASGPVRSWDVYAPDARPPLATGTLVIESWGDELVGSFTMDHQDSSELQCSFVLPHDTAAE